MAFAPPIPLVVLRELLLRGAEAKEGAKISLVGMSGELKWKQNADDLEIEMPGGALPSKYAVTVKMEGME